MEDSLFTTLALPVALAIIMTTLGLSLTPADFRRVFVAPRGVSIGLVNLLLISPLLAFGAAIVWNLPPELAVGLVLLGASPGGTTANLLTHLARGETALSVTMTAVSSVAALVTIPLFLGLSTGWFDAPSLDEGVDLAGVVLRVFFITIVPLSLGMWIRSRWPQRTLAVEPRAKRIALALFVAVVIGALVDEGDRILDNLAGVAGAAITLNLAAMAISFTIARLSDLNDRQATAIALELGVHNSTLTIAVAASIDTVLAIPAAVYSAFMFISAGLFARFMSRRNAPTERGAAAA